MSPAHVPHRPRLWPLLWPLYLELVFGLAVGLVATALAAQVSDAAAGAFSLTNRLQGTLFMLFRILGAGISVVVTQALGSGSRESADRLALAALGASSWIGLLCAALALSGAEPLLRLLQAPAEALPLALPYLRWLAPALLIDAWNASMGSVMRAHLRARDTLMVLVLMNALQLGLALAWMPGHGLVGYAWALLASRCFGLLLHTLLWRWRLGLRPRGADWWRWRKAEVGAMLHIGAPGAAENIAYQLAALVSIAVAAKLGSAALATHAYVSQILFFVLLGGLAIGLSMELLIGHLVGAGRLREADRLLRRGMAIGFACSVGLALLAALAGPWLMRAFTRDPAIVAQASRLLWMSVLLEAGRCFNIIVINALRAAGDARFPVAVGSGSMLLVLAGGSWVLGWTLGLGLTGIWIAYALDEWLRGLMMWARWTRRGWLPHARAARRRVRALERGASA